MLLEGLWEGGVERHMRLVVTQVAKLHQETVLRVELTVSWHQNRRKYWTFNSFVVIWVDAHFFLFGAEWILANLERFELMVGLQVRPAPHAAVDDVWEALPVGHLQPPVQRPRNSNTFAGLPRTTKGLFQVFHGTLFLFQLLHQGIHSFFRPFFLLIALLPAQQPLHCRAGEGKQTRHGGHSAGLHQEAESGASSASSVPGR